MRTSVKLIVSALASSLLLASAISTASARNLSISNQNVRMTWTSLEFNAEEAVVIRCKVTFEGSFHARTIAKVAGALMGAITRAIIKQETCTNGTVSAFNGTERYNGGTPSNSLPWHVTYEDFIGSLPGINSLWLLLSRFRFGVNVTGLCVGQYGNATDTVMTNVNLSAGAVTSIRPVEGSNLATLVRRDGGILCPATGRVQGSGEVMLLGATTRITVTLI